MTNWKRQSLAWIGTAILLLGCGTAAQPIAAHESATALRADQDTVAYHRAKTEAASRLRAMIDNSDAETTESIMALFDRLDPVDTDFMLGTWKGGKFDGGKIPDPINWYGKRFNSANDVEPLLARKPDGTIYSFSKWGMARMREVKYRGKVSASLIYDSKPIMDYFRKIDDNTVLGLGEMKGKITFFFYLTRDKALAEK